MLLRGVGLPCPCHDLNIVRQRLGLPLDQLLQFLRQVLLLLLLFLLLLFLFLNLVEQRLHVEADDFNVLGGLGQILVPPQGVLVVPDGRLAGFEGFLQVAVALTLRLAKGAVAEVVTGAGFQDRLHALQGRLLKGRLRLFVILLPVMHRAPVVVDLRRFGRVHRGLVVGRQGLRKLP